MPRSKGRPAKPSGSTAARPCSVAKLLKSSKPSVRMGIGGTPAAFFLAILSVFFFFFLSFHHHALVSAAAAGDTISVRRPLSGSQTIVSKNGRFEMGFFSPGKSRRFYVGIWYKWEPRETVVWVANRGHPVTMESELGISGDGGLVLTTSGAQVWSSNLITRQRPNTTVAVLRDDGNLVLLGKTNPSVVLWQSFEHPTDTWLPGARVRLGRASGERWVLTSWRGSNDPAPGGFSLRLEGDPLRYFGYLRRPANESYPPRMFGSTRKVDLLDFTFTSIGEDSFFSYTVQDDSINARLVIDAWGNINFWLQRSHSRRRALYYSSYEGGRLERACPPCGPFGSCGGSHCGCLRGFEKPSLSSQKGVQVDCFRRNPTQCGCKDSGNWGRDFFFSVPEIYSYPRNPQYLVTANAEECRLACENECPCVAYSYDVVCLVWTTFLFDVNSTVSLGDDPTIPGLGSGKTLNIRLAAAELETYERKERNLRETKIIVSVGVGCLALLAVVLALAWRLRSTQLNKTWAAAQGSLVHYPYKKLEAITKNFSEKLGKGGFGSVYKGTLPNSDVVAVKTLERRGQGEKQFRTEVSTIGMIQHINLVRLRGFCAEGAKRFLVYDYMPNGSLDCHLFGKSMGVSGAKILDWRTRYQIALGTARGLAYLHGECRACIIHCDIKPENILLDADFSPKVSDFGLAKLVGREFGRALTTMRGTIGYLAPEWISGAPITEKADVYSFGMMLLEVISGKRNIEKSGGGEFVYFPIWAARKVSEGNLVCLVDSRLEDSVNVDELVRACRVACWCIQDSEFHRPSMPQVVLMLEGALKVEVPPIPKFLQNLVEHDGSTQFTFSLLEQSNTSYGSETEGSVPPSYI